MDEYKGEERELVKDLGCRIVEGLMEDTPTPNVALDTMAYALAVFSRSVYAQGLTSEEIIQQIATQAIKNIGRQQ